MNRRIAKKPYGHVKASPDTVFSAGKIDCKQSSFKILGENSR